MDSLFFVAAMLAAYRMPYAIVALIFLALMVFKSYRLPLFSALAFSYALLHQVWVNPALDLSSNDLKRAIIEGQVQSIKQKQTDKCSFYFKLKSINGKMASNTLFLSWYRQVPELLPGQKLRLIVKLKKARNLQNPGAFDYQSWLMLRHVQWTGYIKQALEIGPVRSSLFSFADLRESLSEKVKERQPNPELSGLIQALGLGLGQAIPQAEWDLFRKTGTTHLMVISGAHIGMIAGLCFFIFQFIWRRFPSACLSLPASQAAAIAAFLAAVFYALLSGFSFSAQRALIVCGFFSWQFLGRRKYSVWQIWRYALIAVVLYEPHAVLSPGLYLSFFAVASILLCTQRWPLSGLSQWISVQLACLIGLLPLTLYWFQYGSWIGFFANLLAVPWVGFVVLPLILLYLISFHPWLSYVLTKALLLFLSLLKWLEPYAIYNMSISSLSLNSLIALILALLLFVFIPFRQSGLLIATLIMIACNPPRTEIREGEAIIDILDVGQGLASVIRTKNHLLIYDTGDKFYQGSDMGKLAIIPFLKQKGLQKIDKIIISHPDKDHGGGLKSLEQTLKVKELVVNDKRYYHRGMSCHQMPAWQWDGVDFRFYAIHQSFKKKNNRSCVLKINSQLASLLLTGDIEEKAEDYLVKKYAGELQADYLLVPHHGSKSSSSTAFLKAVRPRFAIASLGFDNRFHFPHPQTLRRYQILDIPFLTTASCGMTTLRFQKDRLAKTWLPACYGKHFWTTL